ncbi:MAG: preprotein translocase subunit YajC [Dongiaceae bacterium]
MFITPAYAQAAGAASAGLDMMSFLPLVLIFVVFYFLLIRPQQQKAKQHRTMISAVRRGDQVVTAGGIIGRINKVISDVEVQIEIAEGVRVRVLKATISEVLTKPLPGAATKSKSKDEQDEEEAEAEDEEDSSTEEPAGRSN